MLRIYPKIDSYIFRTTLMASIFALLLLILIESFFTFLAELQELRQDSYPISALLAYLVLDTPARIYRIFPMALLLGALLGLGQLNATHELVILRATGLGKLRLLAGAIVAGSVLSIGALAIGEYLVPYTQKMANEIKSDTTALRKGKGFWGISEGNIVHVAGANAQGELEDLRIFVIKKQELLKYIRADQAVLQEDHWLITQGREIVLGDNEISHNELVDMRFPTILDKSALSALSASVDTLSIRDLYKFIRYLELNGLDASDYRLAFWSKLFSPLMHLSMLLIALPFIFSHQRQQGVGVRLLIGISIGLLIYLLTRLLGQMVLLYGYLPIVGAVLPTLIVMAIGVIFLNLSSEVRR